MRSPRWMSAVATELDLHHGLMRGLRVPEHPPAPRRRTGRAGEAAQMVTFLSARAPVA